MLKRVVLIFAAVGFLLTFPVTAGAAETGSIQVTLETGQTVTGGSVTLHYAGRPISGGYQLSAVFGGGMVRWDDLPSESLADWLSEHAASQGTTLLLDADGSAVYSPLEPGLYLLTQEDPIPGYPAMAPFVVELPYEDIWQITVLPQVTQPSEIPPTGQSPAPFNAAVVLLVSFAGLLAMIKCRPERCAQNGG